MPGGTIVQTKSFSDSAGCGARFLSYNQFNPELGTLDSIGVTVSTTVAGTLSIENLEARAVYADYAIFGHTNIYAPDGTLLALQESFGASYSNKLASFDGSVDFGGASGLTISTAGTGSTSVTYPSGDGFDGTDFIGTGTVDLAVSDYAENSISGPANMRVLATASVGGNVTLEYAYSASSSLPSNNGSYGGGNDFIITYPPPVTVTMAPQIFHFSDQTTGWQDQILLQQFDASLGQLTNLNVRITSELFDRASVENHGAVAATVRLLQSAVTTLKLEGGTQLAVGVTTDDRTRTVGAADGADDFTGAGGVAEAERVAKSSSLTDVFLNDLGVFSGTGSVSLVVDNIGVGSIRGPASFLAEMAARSNATIEVSYSYAVNPSAAGVMVTDGTTGEAAAVPASAYAGPVKDLQHEFIRVTPDNLSVAANTDNWFIRTGDGDDALAAMGGTNVLDGGGGSNFLTGGFGQDTFFLDVRAAAEDVWSTITNLQGGDAVTVWGISQAGFKLDWADGQGAAGATGLTLHASATGHPTASLTLQGFTTAAFSNGTLALSFGNVDGADYLYIKAN